MQSPYRALPSLNALALLSPHAGPCQAHASSVHVGLCRGAADDVLKGVAHHVLDNLRASGAVFRIGGVEFLLIPPGVDVQEARKRLESICHGLAASPLPTRSGERAVTLSAGLALWPEQGRGLDELRHAADVALYEAKRAGRNRVQVCVQA